MQRQETFGLWNKGLKKYSHSYDIEYYYFFLRNFTYYFFTKKTCKRSDLFCMKCCGWESLVKIKKLEQLKEDSKPNPPSVGGEKTVNVRK